MEDDDLDFLKEFVRDVTEEDALCPGDTAVEQKHEGSGEHGHKDGNDPDSLRGQRIQDEGQIVVVPADVVLVGVLAGEGVEHPGRRRRDDVLLLIFEVELLGLLEAVHDHAGLLAVLGVSGRLRVLQRLLLVESGELFEGNPSERACTRPGDVDRRGITGVGCRPFVLVFFLLVEFAGQRRRSFFLGH